MGLGHFGGGAAAARWLAAQGAIVTVTDLADEKTLAAALQSLAGCRIAAFHLGGHREEDFRQADLVVVNPAVRPENPWLAIARENGVRLTTEIDLFLAGLSGGLDRRDGLQRKIDDRGHDRRHPPGRRPADLAGRKHRRQPVGSSR